MFEIRCAEIWGGSHEVNTEVCTAVLTAAISSTVCQDQPHPTAAGPALGGDIYYFSVCSYDKLTRVAIADMRGHGSEAAVLSGWLYNALEQRMNSLDGAGILTELNTLVRSKGFSAITTAALATYYRDERKLYFSYAGHPPLLLRSNHDGWRSIPLDQAPGVANLPLGIIDPVRYDQCTMDVMPGDRICLYTDGLTERPNEQGEMFGEERLRAILESAGSLDLAGAKQRVLEALDEFAGTAAPDDDCTVMLIEIRP